MTSSGCFLAAMPGWSAMCSWCRSGWRDDSPAMTPRLFLTLLLVAVPAAHEAPCVRPTRPNTVVQGDVAICRGRYRIPDPDNQGVIVIGSAGTQLDLTGVTLESGCLL